MANALEIHLTKKEVDDVFNRRDKKKWEKIIGVYTFLLENLARADAVDVSGEYQKKFNYFYQVRRNAQWREDFYALFFRYSKGKNADFADILKTLHVKTGKIEASFASKFAATIDPELPLIDRHVLSHIERKLPSSQWSPADRMFAIIELHDAMRKEFAAFLSDTPSGKHLIKRFKAEYPKVKISEMKMLDFVLWQSGGKKKKNNHHDID